MTEKRLPTLQPPHPAENFTFEQAIQAVRKVKADRERNVSQSNRQPDAPAAPDHQSGGEGA
jgi:hypothetical protein